MIAPKRDGVDIDPGQYFQSGRCLNQRNGLTRLQPGRAGEGEGDIGVGTEVG